MAPGRPRGTPKGQARIDAAFDALLPMGFLKSAIRKKVEELLKLYGGTHGWVFIEEASYKLLIEQLLGGEDGSEPGEDGSEPGPPLSKCEAANQDNMLGDAGSSSAAGPSNATLIPPPDMMDAEKGDDGYDEEDCSFKMDCDSHQDSAVTSTDDAPPPPPETEYVPPPPPAPPPEEPSVAPKRKPCYGWWGEETEVIYLPLMPIRPKNSRP